MREEIHDPRKWWASALMVGAMVGLACLLLGALGSRFGAWDFRGGFMLLAVGTVLASIVFFLGVIGYVYCISKKLQAEISAVLIGVVISLIMLALMGDQFLAATAVPPIHNISTDTESPPQFDKLIPIREALGANPHEYDTEALADIQKEAYPHIQPLISNMEPGEMFYRIVAVLDTMGMEVVGMDSVAGRVEATDTTFWFGFKDDVVVRIRRQNSGCVVDIRSVSRVGQSDLGKNAERIGEILDRLKSS